MLSLIKRITILVVVLFVGFITYYNLSFSSISSSNVYYKIPQRSKDNKIHIGIVGDSWAAGTKMDSAIHIGMLGKGLQNIVISSGQVGAKTKVIYQNLFKLSNDPKSSKFIIDQQPDYCVIMGGVNDATGQVGSSYYAQHMVLIIKTLLHYNIKPVVVELPEFGIEEVTEEFNFMRRWRNKTYSMINNHGNIDNIQAYRDALLLSLKETKLMDSIIYVNYNLCTDYRKAKPLYSNRSHLTKDGYRLLGNHIADQLAAAIKQGK